MIGKDRPGEGGKYYCMSVRMQWVISVKYCVRVRMQ
jgi:hypothetical protein